MYQNRKGYDKADLAVMIQGLWLGLNALDIELDIDVVSNNETAAVQSLAPDHSEILAIEFPFCIEAGPGIAHGIFSHAIKIPRQRDVFGHSPERELSDGLIAVGRFLVLLHPVSYDRMLFDVEEIGISQVCIAFLMIRIHRSCFNRRLDGLDRAGFRIHLDESLVIGEVAGRV